MFSYIFHTFFYNPIYNGLIFLISYFSWVDVGIAVVLLTLLVKFILFPLTKKSVITQIKMRQIEPELEKIKKMYEKDKERQAREIMDLYKRNEINPFSGILLVFIQIPIIFALYFVFLDFNGGDVVKINTDILYSFNSIPQNINMNFLGIIDVREKSMFLAILAGILQYFQIKITLPKLKTDNKEEKNSFKDDLMKSMQFQMLYIMPFFIVFIAYSLALAIALYWVVSSIFTILQELIIRRKIKV